MKRHRSHYLIASGNKHRSFYLNEKKNMYTIMPSFLPMALLNRPRAAGGYSLCEIADGAFARKDDSQNILLHLHC